MFFAILTGKFGKDSSTNTKIPTQFEFDKISCKFELTNLDYIYLQGMWNNFHKLKKNYFTSSRVRLTKYNLSFVRTRNCKLDDRTRKKLILEELPNSSETEDMRKIP